MQSPFRFLLFFGCAWLLWADMAQAQIYPFRNYTLIDGLPDSHVKAILEDHNSYIWFATEGGASKFDGKKFIKYSTEHGLLSNNINHIIEDEDNQIWLATRAGVSRFDGLRFHNYTEKQGLVGNDVYFILEDSNRNFWFATARGLSKFDGKKFTNYTIFNGLPDNSVWALKEDAKGNIWIGTSGGVARFDGKNFKSYTTEDGLPSNLINCIFDDKDKNLWFGTAEGAAKLNSDGSFEVIDNLPDNNIFSGLADEEGNLVLSTQGGVVILKAKGRELITNKNGLVNDQVNFVLRDRNKNLWFGTDGGASKLSNRRFNVLSSPLLRNKAVTAIVEDEEGNMWFGTRGGGLIQYTPQGDVLSYDRSDGLSSNNIKALHIDARGQIWVGTLGGGLCKFDGKKFTVYDKANVLTDDYIYCIVEDDQGRLWLGTDEGLSRFDGENFTNFSRAQGLADNYVRCALKDRDGNLWFGTYGGLSRYDKTGFTNFSTKNGLANNLVLSIIQDREGYLWLATENGLCKMKKDASPNKPDCFECFSKKDNLSSQNLWSLVEDNEGNIWMGHRSGVERFNPQKRAFQHFGYIDGFVLIQTFPNAIFKDSKGHIWFGAFDGVVQYNPTEDKRNNVPPTTHIVDVKLFNKAVNWRIFTDSLHADFHIPIKKANEDFHVVLDYDQNHISFDFIGIHFTIPERVQYQYKLEGFDKDWSELTAQSSATYTNLPPGNYSFKVKAANSDGVFNKEYTEFNFKIELPYWEKWWFYMAQLSFFITLLLISLYLGTRRRGSRYTLILSITTLLIFFEFVSVYIEDYVESYLGNIPVYKVIINVLIASTLAPFEMFVRQRITSPKPALRVEESEEASEDIVH